MQLDDLDVPFSELVDEVGVVALGVVDPHHVVEEQVVRVGRGEPAVREAGGADQDLAESADLRVDAVRRAGAAGGVGRHESLPGLRVKG
ncbi:hypothetical protein QFZ68_005678 [Streptomyces sp. V1I6]|nr:hypothetical protein [Streptomyces sp. V1I6]